MLHYRRSALAASSGKEVLDWLSFGHTSLPRSLGAQARILAFWCVVETGRDGSRGSKSRGKGVAVAYTIVAYGKALLCCGHVMCGCMCTPVRRYWTTLCLLRAGGPRYQVVEEVEEAAAEPAVSDITTPAQAATA